MSAVFASAPISTYGAGMTYGTAMPTMSYGTAAPMSTMSYGTAAPVTYGGSISAAPALPAMGSYIAPSVGSYGLGMPAMPMTTAMPAMTTAMPTMSYPAPTYGGSIAASVGGSISAPAMIGSSVSGPVSLPVSNTFSGYTATPFLPASSYHPATFGGPVATTTGMPLPTPLAASVSSLPYSGYGGYGTTYAPRTYTTGATYGAPTTYGSTYGAPAYSYGTTYGAPTTTYSAPAPGTPTPA